MDFPISIDFGANGGVHKFRNTEAVRQFIEAEYTAWNWLPEILRTVPNDGSLQGLHDAWNKLIQFKNNSLEHLNQNNIDQAHSFINNYFNSSNTLPFSETIRAFSIFRVRESLSARAGLGAVAATMGLRFDAHDPEQVRGVIAAHEQLQATGPLARQSVQNALSALFKRLAIQQDRAEERADALDKRVEAIEAKRRRHFARLLQEGDRSRKAFASDIDAEVERVRMEANEAIASIKATEKVYSEHMGLKGPVVYWTDKATEHRKNSAISMVVGLSFAIILILYAVIDGINRVIDLVKSTVNETHIWQIGYVVLTAVLFILTIAFWIGRLISRTYVSQSHLAIDAEERATMVQTYLALANANQISDAERILVLSSLFRTSSDGLVRDDASPDLGVAGLLSKLGAGSNTGR